MKKFTLLLGLAVAAGLGSVSAQEPEVIRGIKITPDDAAPEARYYYSISNMRIQRLNYTDGRVAGYDFDTNETLWGEGEEYMVDAMQVPLPLFLPDGYPADWEEGSTLDEFDPADYKLTPQPYTMPNMGLANVDGAFWLAFSAQTEVMNPNTTYWYFTKGSGSSNVRIHNAVIDGTVKRNSGTVLGRSATGFDTKENNYYVLNLKDVLIEAFGEGEMALSDEQMDAAFALSTANLSQEKIDEGDYSPISTTCLDANNYISYNYITNRLNPDGSDYMQEVEDEEGNPVEQPVELKYGFASVTRCWSPLTTNGVNANHLYNNGSLFFVNEQPVEDALAAIEAYKDVVIATYREGARKAAQAAYTDAAAILQGWLNVPALWQDQTTLEAIIAEMQNYDGGTAESVVDLATQEQYIATAKAAAQKKVVTAAGLVGTGAIVTFQNQLALRDVVDADDESMAEEYQLGNAYISANKPGLCNYDGMIETGYTGIAPVLEADEYCQWELIPVAGTTNFYLYNAKSNTYIRKYTGMFELAGGEDIVGDGANNFTWATTADVAEAAPFTFVGCADPEDQTPLSDDDQILVEDYGVDTDITNNVYLQSTFTETSVDENTGETTETEVTTHIHRTSGAYDYNFVNYGFENNRWYANSNIFKINVLVAGGIDEIEAAETAKATGIYDLQGRKVAKAGKGLYIINGVKTIVR